MTAPDPGRDGFLVPPGFAAELEKLWPWQERLFWAALAETAPVTARSPVPRRWRLRGRVSPAREWLARRAFRVIAGFEVERDDDY